MSTGAADRTRLVKADERAREILTAWNAGWPVEQIAEARGISVGHVPEAARRAARRLGLELNRPRAPRGGVAAGDLERWFERANPGRCRAAVELTLVGVGLAGSQRVTAELVRDVADLCDAARERQDPKLWLAASRQLGALLGQLGLETPPPAIPGVPADDPIGDALGSGPE